MVTEGTAPFESMLRRSTTPRRDSREKQRDHEEYIVFFPATLLSGLNVTALIREIDGGVFDEFRLVNLYEPVVLTIAIATK